MQQQTRQVLILQSTPFEAPYIIQPMLYVFHIAFCCIPSSFIHQHIYPSTPRTRRETIQPSIAIFATTSHQCIAHAHTGHGARMPRICAHTHARRRFPHLKHRILGTCDDPKIIALEAPDAFDMAKPGIDAFPSRRVPEPDSIVEAARENVAGREVAACCPEQRTIGGSNVGVVARSRGWGWRVM